MKIAIIEDEPAHFTLMRRHIVKEFPHSDIYHFQEACACLDQIPLILPDLIITDYLLPGMNGITFLEAIQQRRIDTAVIMITGQGDENVAVRAMKLGAIDYLVKSGDFFALLPAIIEKAVQKKRLEQSLLRSEKRFQDLAENTSDWIWEMDAGGQYIYSNPVVKEVIGIDRSAVVGKFFYDFFAGENKSVLQARIFERMSALEPIKSLENVLVCKDGGEAIVETSAVPFLDKEGGLLGYRGINRDITDRKRAEYRIQHLSQQLLQAQEIERKMISCELHDRVAQDLSAAKIEFYLLSKAPRIMEAGVKENLRKTAECLERAINAIRDLSYELQPPALQEMGLVKALEMYCEDFFKQHQLKVDFQAPGLHLFNLDANMEIQLYRLVQEGLNNVRKHAGTDRALVRLIGSYPDILLRIEDSGKGFDLKARELELDAEKRMGLRSMRERAHLLGGQTIIHSKPEKGTKILIKIPSLGQSGETQKTHFHHR